MPPSARQGKTFHFHPNDGGIRFHQNVNVHVTDFTTSDPEDLKAGHTMTAANTSRTVLAFSEINAVLMR